MARITCAISGIKFTTSYFDSLALPHTEGYIHPIFALERVKLYPYYQEHCLGKLTAVDSYLLFLAFLHSSEKVTWNYPASCNPQDSSTKHMIETNLAQLIAVLEKTDLIKHPQFEQPAFKVYHDNSNLAQLPNWVSAWEDNITYFYTKRATQVEIEDLQRLENKLTDHIYSGNPPEKYARVIAEWASKAGEFPPHLADLWKETIRSCFSITKMFNTPLPLLKEIKDHIECNITAGSIHFSAVHEVITDGISKHVDYLGGSSLALGYTLLPSLDSFGKSVIPAAELKGSAEVATIAAAASEHPPTRLEYPDTVSFIKAKLAYRVACNIAIAERKQRVVDTVARDLGANISATPKDTNTNTNNPTKQDNALPLLVDTDLPLPESYNMDINDIEEELESYSLEDSDLDGLTIIDTGSDTEEESR